MSDVSRPIALDAERSADGDSGTVKVLSVRGTRAYGGLRVQGLFTKRSEEGRPLVSIITVVRNGGEYFKQTLRSVLNQTYDNIEYIVVDGASTDGTVEFIREHENRIAYWLSEPDSGHYEAMNKGSMLATGDYALYLNADDYLYPEDSLEGMLRKGLGGGRYPLLVAGSVRIGFQDEIWDWQQPANETLLLKYGLAHQGTLVHATIYKRIPYGTMFKVYGDMDYWERVRQAGLFDIQYVDHCLAVYRIEGGSTSPRLEYRIPLESEISRYTLYGVFSVRRVLCGRCVAIAKIWLLRLFGKRTYYRYILYGKYCVLRAVWNFIGLRRETTSR